MTFSQLLTGNGWWSGPPLLHIPLAIFQPGELTSRRISWKLVHLCEKPIPNTGIAAPSDSPLAAGGNQRALGQYGTFTSWFKNQNIKLTWNLSVYIMDRFKHVGTSHGRVSINSYHLSSRKMSKRGKKATTLKTTSQFINHYLSITNVSLM